MIIIVAFTIKNSIEVMEGRPIEMEGMTFFLEHEKNVLKNVCLAFSNVSIERAPDFKPANSHRINSHLKISNNDYVALAMKTIMSWQAIVSGFIVEDLDYDHYELKFEPETIDPEPHSYIKSFKSDFDRSMNPACDVNSSIIAVAILLKIESQQHAYRALSSSSIIIE